MVKRFLAERSGRAAKANRYAPETFSSPAQFEVKIRKAIVADETELEVNPRSRSAKLRVAMRTDAPAGDIDPKSIGMPYIKGLM